MICRHSIRAFNSTQEIAAAVRWGQSPTLGPAKVIRRASAIMVPPTLRRGAGPDRGRLWDGHGPQTGRSADDGAIPLPVLLPVLLAELLGACRSGRPALQWSDPGGRRSRAGRGVLRQPYALPRP